MRVLLVEGDENVAGSLARKLKEAKILSDCLDDIELALEAPPGAFETYAAVLLGQAGLSADAVSRLRQENASVPIVALSDFKNAEAAIAVFNAGADDFVIKPFNPHELKARINAVARRNSEVKSPTLELGRLTVYLDDRDPEVDGEPIKLSHREHAIFRHLVQNVGRVVSKEAVYSAVYGMIDCEPFEKVIDVYICKLRKKLAGPTGGQQFIETVFCRGYKLDHPEKVNVQRLGSGGAKSRTRQNAKAA